jgi:hypothetical protein
MSDRRQNGRAVEATLGDMTTAPTRTFSISALPRGVLDRVRTEPLDATGSEVVDLPAGGGEPLRCCLRDARPGESLVLFRYAPPHTAGPYREVGPVFAHADDCGGYDGDGYPADWRSRPQVLRAYDDRGRIHEATRLHDGTDPGREIVEVLAQPGVVAVHSRNIAYGCFMFAVTRR